MARRKSTRMSRMKNIEPSVLTLAYLLPAGAPTVSHIDLSQSASLINRRFYRQGLNWAVAGFRLVTPTGVTGGVSVLKLPNTWVLSNSWHKSFAVWNRMNKAALAENESIRPRFLDFKIYSDAVHHNAGYAANLLPISGAAAPAIAGEWESSKIYVPIASTLTPAPGGPDMQDYEIIATGPSYPGASAVTGLDAVSLIEGYASSRGLPNVLDPNAPDDIADTGGLNPENWMSAMFNEGETQQLEVLEDMITENNIAPYPFENDGVNVDTMYPGGANQLAGQEYHDSAFVSPTTIGGITSVRGSNFPCGLITVAHNLTAPAEGGVILQVMLMPGNHRGYLAEKMQDM
ncbi:MAG: hypothetical protein [Circular genetic element sp.]|nr:MAG: hypothetical protein [Circular genetic element sp.]